MKTSNLLLLALLPALTACGVKNKTKTTSRSADSVKTENTPAKEAATLTGSLVIKDTIKMGEPLQLKFTVYNKADSIQQFCKWHTPFEPLMSKYLEVKDENGQEAAYLGAMAKRMMPPPLSSYVKVKAKDSLTTTVDLGKAYAITKPAKYTIKYVGQDMSGIVVKDSVTFVYLK